MNTICEVPLAPSSFNESPITTRGAGSSSAIVTVEPAVPIVAFTGAERVTMKVWFGSSTTSPLIETLICLAELEPAFQCSVPEAET
jgi:hypothetical protein